MTKKNYTRICVFCGAEYDPRERYLAHKPERCELMRLRRVVDLLVDWADQADAFERDGGEIKVAFKIGTDLDSVVASARDLKMRMESV